MWPVDSISVQFWSWAQNDLFVQTLWAWDCQFIPSRNSNDVITTVNAKLSKLHSCLFLFSACRFVWCCGKGASWDWFWLVLNESLERLEDQWTLIISLRNQHLKAKLLQDDEGWWTKCFSNFGFKNVKDCAYRYQNVQQYPQLLPVLQTKQACRDLRYLCAPKLYPQVKRLNVELNQTCLIKSWGNIF